MQNLYFGIGDIVEINEPGHLEGITGTVLSINENFAVVDCFGFDKVLCSVGLLSRAYLVQEGLNK